MITYTNIDDLNKLILKKSVGISPFIIAVDGFGGAGKSVLCKQLTDLLSNSIAIQTDNFIVHPHEPNVFDHDWQAIEDKVLIQAKTAKQVVIKTYDWKTLSKVPDVKVKVPKYVVVDGIGLLDPKYSRYFDLKIWIDCPYALSLERCKRRDKEEGTDHDELWNTVWGPGEKAYFERSRPDMRADLLFKTY
jgi:uridine kinase